MRCRRLKDYVISEVGLGCWQLGGNLGIGRNSFGLGEVSEEEAEKIVEAAYENYVNFFDTADFYGLGRSERILGKVLKKYRHNVIIATKVGFVVDGMIGVVTDFSYNHIKASCDRSLQRLGVDCIDLYQLHCPPPTDQEECAFEALEDLKREGKIFYAGVSVANNFEKGAVLLKKFPFDAIQFYYNILNRGAEEILFPIIAGKKIGAIISSPFGRGVLTGKFHSLSEFSSGDSRNKWNEGGKERTYFLKQLESYQLLSSIAKEYKMSTLELNISYILGWEEVSVIIPGASNAKQACENARLSGSSVLNKKEIWDLRERLACQERKYK